MRVRVTYGFGGGGSQNQPPVITSIPNQSNTEGDVVSLQVNATDPENGVLTYSASSLPTGLSINSSTGLISGTISVGAETSSPYITTITVTDDGSPIGSSQILVTWNVSAPAVNQPPIVTTIPTQTNDESDVVSLQVSATDPDGNNLSYSATGLPSGLSINSATGLISGTISAGAATSSPYTTTVTVTDDGSPIESTDEVFTWNVAVVVVSGPVDTSLYDSSGNQIAASVLNGDIPIDYYAFGANGSSSAVDVEFGTSCTSIGDYAFGGGSNLIGSTGAQVVVGPNITTISNSACYYTQAWSAIASMVIPSSVTSIGGYAFGGSALRIIYSDVPSSAFIGSNAFYDDSFAANRIIYVSPTYFGVGSNYDAAWQSAQQYNVNGTSTIVNWVNYPNPIPNPTAQSILYDSSGVTIASVSGNFGNSVQYPATSEPNQYYGNTALKRLKLGTSCLNINSGSFYGCTNLEGPLYIGDGVNNSATNIGEAAFNNCSSLNGKVIIGSTVTNIGQAVFADQSSSMDIEELYLDVPSSVWNGFSFVGSSPNMTIYVSPTYFGVGSNYDATWFSNENLSGGVTIVNWNNYPNPIPN